METNTNTNTNARKDFETVKRDFETAYASGADYGKELIDLATAFAYSVINKVIDPQRKTAAAREEISDNGHNPALVSVKRGIKADLDLLEKTRYSVNAATALVFNIDGDISMEIVDADENRAAAAFCRQSLTDGIDLVQTAAAAILEQYKRVWIDIQSSPVYPYDDVEIPVSCFNEFIDCKRDMPNEYCTMLDGTEKPYATALYMDMRYKVRRLSKKVYIRETDSAAYSDEYTTAAREVFRAVRAAVAESRAVQIDPRNGYSYIEDLTADGLDTIYYRLSRYADLGGYDNNGLYTADKETARDYNDLLTALNLTARQAEIVRLRMQGKGYKAIATYLGVSYQAVQNTLAKVQKKAVAIGLTAPDKIDLEIDRPAAPMTAYATFTTPTGKTYTTAPRR